MHQSDLSKADRERQVSHDITCMWNLKHDTNEFRNRPTVLEKRRVVGNSPWARKESGKTEHIRTL